MSIMTAIQPALITLGNIALFIIGLALGILAMGILTQKIVGYLKGGGRTLSYTRSDRRNRAKQKALLAVVLVVFIAASAGIWFAIGALIWATYFLSLTLGAIIGAVILFVLDRSRLA